MKRIIIVLCFFLMSLTNVFGQIRGLSVRSPFIKKYLVLQKLQKLTLKNDKAVEKAGYQQMVKVIFRNNQRLYDRGRLEPNSSIDALVTYLNTKVDRIYTGLVNFKGFIKIANLSQKEDLKLLQVIGTLISNEIGETSVSTRAIMKSFAKIKSNLDTITVANNKKKDNAKKTQNLEVTQKLIKALDMAKYIYTEQIRWIITSLYVVDNFTELVRRYNINEPKKLPEFNFVTPPRIFIPIFRNSNPLSLD